MGVLGVSRNTLCRWVREGKLVAIKVGKNYRFDGSVVADWIESHQM